MAVHKQRSLEDEYLEQCDKAKAQALQQLVGQYYYVRSVVLGLPIPTGQQGPQGQPQFSVSGEPGFKLADRIAAHGQDFGDLMMEAESLRKFVEEKVAKALIDLGDPNEDIRRNGNYGFLLNLFNRDEKGKITTYKGLESNPFSIFQNSNIPGQPPKEYVVTLGVNGDGNGTVNFEAVSGQVSDSDPL